MMNMVCADGPEMADSSSSGPMGSVREKFEAYLHLLFEDLLTKDNGLTEKAI